LPGGRVCGWKAQSFLCTGKLGNYNLSMKEEGGGEEQRVRAIQEIFRRQDLLKNTGKQVRDLRAGAGIFDGSTKLLKMGEKKRRDECGEEKRSSSKTFFPQPVLRKR